MITGIHENPDKRVLYYHTLSLLKLIYLTIFNKHHLLMLHHPLLN